MSVEEDDKGVLEDTSANGNINGAVQPLLTDLYQINMAYAYWKSGKMSDTAVFDLFFRKNPFQGEFTIFAGLEQCVQFLKRFKYSVSDIKYLRGVMASNVENDFFEFLEGLTAQDVVLHAIEEGKVVFPRVPFITVEGPLIVVQLMETTLLNLVNFASLIATNAARFRLASGDKMELIEFGLRRAQGPDGGLSASKYSYMGGFDGTSNVMAGKLFNIPVRGTHAHSFVSAFSSLDEVHQETLPHKESGDEMNLKELSLEFRKKVSELLNIIEEEASDGELTAFISFAIAFPYGFLALVDTYDVLRSGLLNFCAVSLALHECGYQTIGIRLDSGDLAHLSCAARDIFNQVAQEFSVEYFGNSKIVASNDINEEAIHKLNQKGHKIDCLGIGTHLVTCQKQLALGCVFKLVEINGVPKIKLSQDVEKVTCPGKKIIYRLYGEDGCALVDLMQRPGEDAPQDGVKILCRHPFLESRRVYVTPSKVELLQKVFWSEGQVKEEPSQLEDVRTRVRESLQTLRQSERNIEDSSVKHREYINKVLVAVSNDLYKFLHDMWLQNAPIGEIF